MEWGTGSTSQAKRLFSPRAGSSLVLEQEEKESGNSERRRGGGERVTECSYRQRRGEEEKELGNVVTDRGARVTRKGGGCSRGSEFG